MGPLSGIRGIQDGGVCCHPGLLFSAIAAAVWLGIWALLCVLQHGLPRRRAAEQVCQRPQSTPHPHTAWQQRFPTSKTGRPALGSLQSLAGVGVGCDSSPRGVLHCLAAICRGGGRNTPMVGHHLAASGVEEGITAERTRSSGVKQASRVTRHGLRRRLAGWSPTLAREAGRMLELFDCPRRRAIGAESFQLATSSCTVNLPAQ